MSKVMNSMLKEFPVAKEIYELGTSTLEKAEAEQKRASEATDSNALGKFIVSQRSNINELKAKHTSAEGRIIHAANEKYSKLKVSEKTIYRNLAVAENAALNTAALASHSAPALFQRVVEHWIIGSKSGGKASYVFVRLNKNWEVTLAAIHAPFGQRLAEHLLSVGKGIVKLNELDVPRTVEFMPEDLTWVTAKFDSSGKSMGGIEYNMFGRKYLATFIRKMQTQGIPATQKLIGV